MNRRWDQYFHQAVSASRRGGVYGAVFLELFDPTTRKRWVTVGKNLVLDRGIDFILSSMVSAQLDNGLVSPGITLISNALPNPWANLVLSDGGSDPTSTESSGALNANGGANVRVIPTSLRALSLSGPVDAQDSAYDVVFVRNPGDPFIVGFTIESVGFSAGPDSGAGVSNYAVATVGGDNGGSEALVVAVGTGAASQWATRYLLGSVAFKLIDSGGSDQRPLVERGIGASLTNPTDFEADSDVVTPANVGEHAFSASTATVWRTDDVAATHWISRSWAVAYTLSEITITAVDDAGGGGYDADEVPDQFRIQVETVPNVWEDVSFTRISDSAYYTGTADAGQATKISAGLANGEVYRLEFPTLAYGVRILSIKNPGTDAAIGTRIGVGSIGITASDDTYYVVTLGVNDVLRARANANPYTVVTVPPGSYSAKELVGIVNGILLPLDVEWEAYTDGLNRFGVRSRKTGANATVDVDTVGNGSTFNSLVGYAAGGESDTGADTPVTPGANDLFTLVYRIGVILE